MPQTKLKSPKSDLFNELKKECKTKEDVEFLHQLEALRGSLRRGNQTTDEELREIREKVFKELEEKFKLSPRAS